MARAARPAASFAAWRNDFRGYAIAQGITPATFDAAFRETGFIPASNSTKGSISNKTFQRVPITLDLLRVTGADRHAVLVRKGPGGPVIGSAVI